MAELAPNRTSIVLKMKHAVATATFATVSLFAVPPLGQEQCGSLSESFEQVDAGTLVRTLPGWVGNGPPQYEPTIQAPSAPSTRAMRMGGGPGGGIIGRQLMALGLPSRFTITFLVTPELTGASWLDCPYSPSSPNEVRGYVTYQVDGANSFVECAATGSQLPIVAGVPMTISMLVDTAGELTMLVDDLALSSVPWVPGNPCPEARTLSFFSAGTPGPTDQNFFWVDDICITASSRIDVPYDCPGVPNVTGAIGDLSAVGFTSIAFNDIRFLAHSLPPHQFGMLVTSAAASHFPAANYTLCLAGPVTRVLSSVTASDAAGALCVPFDTSTPVQIGASTGAVRAGSTWHFQWWHRDVNTSGFNLSAPTSVTFRP